MPNPVVYFEIGCRDMAKTQEFFGKLFDWKLTPSGPATMIDTGGVAPGDITRSRTSHLHVFLRPSGRREDISRQGDRTRWKDSSRPSQSPQARSRGSRTPRAMPSASGSPRREVGKRRFLRGNSRVEHRPRSAPTRLLWISFSCPLIVRRRSGIIYTLRS